MHFPSRVSDSLKTVEWTDSITLFSISYPRLNLSREKLDSSENDQLVKERIINTLAIEKDEL